MLARLPIDTSDLLDLTPTLLKFIGHYCSNNFMEVEAYRKTWPAKAKQMTSQEIRLDSLHILNNRSVKIAVERFVNSVLDPYRDKLEHQVLNVLRSQAFYDIADYFYPDGSVKPLDKIDPDKRNAIESVMRDLKGARGEAELVNYKLADKRSAIKMLTDLLKKDGEGKDAFSAVSEDNRKRVSDIMAGALAGIEAERNSTKPVEPKQANTYKPESEDVEVVEDEIDIDNSNDMKQLEAAVEKTIIVVKAKQIATKETFGMDVENHELVKKAREVARKSLGK